MEHTVCHFEIPVDDLEQARKFYGDLLGWKLTAAPGLDDQYLFISTSERPTALGGALLTRKVAGQGVTVFVTVSSVDETVAKLEELGGAVLVPKSAIPEMGWVVTARDPQGNSIGFFQPDRKAS